MQIKKFFRCIGLIFDVRRIPMDIGRLCCLPLQLFFRMKAVDTSGKPYRKILRGGAVLAPNHPTFMDPLAVICLFWYRRVFCMAGEALMSNTLKKVLLGGMGCISIDRTRSDIDAVRKAKKILDGARPLTVFMEGGIHRDSELGAYKGGAVLLAVQSGVPIIPMYSGKRRHWYNRRLFVIGEPFYCSDHCAKRFPAVGDIEKMTLLVHDECEKCRNTYIRLTGGAAGRSEPETAMAKTEEIK